MDKSLMGFAIPTSPITSRKRAQMQTKETTEQQLQHESVEELDSKLEAKETTKQRLPHVSVQKLRISQGSDIERMRQHEDFDALTALVQKVKSLRMKTKAKRFAEMPSKTTFKGHMLPQQVIDAVVRMQSLRENRNLEMIPRGRDLLLDSFINDALGVLQREMERCNTLIEMKIQASHRLEHNEKDHTMKRKGIERPSKLDNRKKRKLSSNSNQARREKKAMADPPQRKLSSPKRELSHSSVTRYPPNTVHSHSDISNGRSTSENHFRSDFQDQLNDPPRSGQRYLCHQASFTPGHDEIILRRGASKIRRSTPSPKFPNSRRQVEYSPRDQKLRIRPQVASYSVLGKSHSNVVRSAQVRPRYQLVRARSWRARPSVVVSSPYTCTAYNEAIDLTDTQTAQEPQVRNRRAATPRHAMMCTHDGRDDPQLYIQDDMEDGSSSDDEVTLVGVSKPIGRRQWQKRYQAIK